METAKSNPLLWDEPYYAQSGVRSGEFVIVDATRNQMLGKLYASREEAEREVERLTQEWRVDYPTDCQGD